MCSIWFVLASKVKILPQEHSVAPKSDHLSIPSVIRQNSFQGICGEALLYWEMHLYLKLQLDLVKSEWGVA